MCSCKCDRVVCVRSESIDVLPDELLMKIFSYLNMEELLKFVMPVCEKWSIAASHESLWTRLTFEGKKYSTRSICSILRIASALHSMTLISVPKTDVILNDVCTFNSMIKELTVKNSVDHLDIDTMQNIFRTCTDLQKINFKGTDFDSDNLYQQLILLINLRSLNFSINDNYLDSDRLIEMLLNCGRLEELSLHNHNPTNPVLSDEFMPLILERFKSSLRCLKLDCSALGLHSYKVILKCSRLECLSLKNAILLRSREFRNIPLKLYLKKLKIDNAHNLRNEDIMVVFDPKHRRMANMHTFGLSHFNYLEDSGLEAILTSCGSNLKELILEGCKNLSSSVLITALKICSNLEYLNIAFIPAASKIQFSDIIPVFVPNLREIIIDESIDSDELALLNSRLPALLIKISESSFFKKQKVCSLCQTASSTTRYVVRLKE